MNLKGGSDRSNHNRESCRNRNGYERSQIYIEDTDEEKFEDILENLCVAKFAQNYCKSCASGSGCCADRQSSTSFDMTSKNLDTTCDTSHDYVNILSKDDEYAPEEIHLTTETVHTSTSDYITSSNTECRAHRAHKSDMDFETFPTSYLEENFEDCPDNEIYGNEDKIEDATHEDSGEEEETNLLVAESKPKRRRLKIDLSKNEDLSDGEIIRRLLSPTESISSEEPLEVILEIVDEEDEGTSTSKTNLYQAVREKLRNSTFRKAASPKVATSKKSHFPLVDTDRHSSGNSHLISKICKSPSYRKASALICEIEKCFKDTASMVEQTMDAVKTQGRILPAVGYGKTPNNVSLKSKRLETDRQKLSRSIQDALNIFDSILNNHKVQHSNVQRSQNNADATIHLNDTTHSNGNQSDNCIYRDNNYRNVQYTNHYYQPTNYPDNNYQSSVYGVNKPDPSTCFQNGKLNLSDGYRTREPVNNSHEDIDTKQFWKNWTTGFDKDIEELFRECYEISSVGPSVTLGSCLKNLESLCFQLREAKENILHELAEEGNKGLSSIKKNRCRKLSEESQQKLFLINELLEKKLKSKLKMEKFHLGPPLMGLEGKTHKIIAEVYPEKSHIENGYPPTKENVKYYDGLNNISCISPKSYYLQDKSLENYCSKDNSDMHDSAFETTSEISMTTNTGDSFSTHSLSQTESRPTSQNESRPISQSRSYDINCRQSYTDAKDESVSNPSMSYEETLALYEDNQELQQSLLSILHSLNDIHDNFLKRRKLEVALSQQSSETLHNNIRASLDNKRDALTLELIGQDTQRSVTKAFNKKNFLKSDGMMGDYESIEEINKVSDELKNLWLYQGVDLQHKRHKPTRSLSLNRYYTRPKRHRGRYGTGNSEDDELTEEENYNSKLKYDKSCSMPNLNFSPNNMEYEYRGQLRHSQKPHLQNINEDYFGVPMKMENSHKYDIPFNSLKAVPESSFTEHLESRKKFSVPEVTLSDYLIRSFGDFSTKETLENQNNYGECPQYNAYMRTY